MLTNLTIFFEMLFDIITNKMYNVDGSGKRENRMAGSK